MKNGSENNIKFIIKDISVGTTMTAFNGYCVEISMLSENFKRGGIVISLALLEEEWMRFLKFLEKTNKPEALPVGKMAYSGYEIFKDKIFYHEPVDFVPMIKTSNEEAARISDVNKRQKMAKHVNRLIDETMAEEQELKKGEFLNKRLIIRNKNVMISMTREDFKSLREECFSFEANRGRN